MSVLFFHFSEGYGAEANRARVIAAGLNSECQNGRLLARRIAQHKRHGGYMMAASARP